MSSIEIKNLSGTSNFNVRIHDDLPELPFSMIVGGPSKSGKSNLIKNLLQDKYYLRAFDTDSIFIFCPSIDLNDDYEYIETRYKFNEFSESKLREIMSKQEDVVKNFGKKRTKHLLIILDDCFDNPSFAHSNVVQRLFMRSRHSLISVICSGQKLSSVPRGARLNTNYLIIFRPSNLSKDPKRRIRIGFQKEFGIH
jgi:septin family protein